MSSEGIEITRSLARYAVRSHFDGLPHAVSHEACRAFLNWLGCVLGGCREPTVQTALLALDDLSGRKQATVVGRHCRVDLLSATFLNSLSAGVRAFEDTHLKTICHPSVPVASAVFALAEYRTISGPAFLNALILGIEFACRMSNVVSAPPAQFHIGLSTTGLTGAIGAAAAVGKLLDLDEQAMICALGIAANRACGLREANGSMTGHMAAANAGRAGLEAAFLAARGFTCTERVLEGPRGFANVYAASPNIGAAIDRLGTHHEALNIAYKPYPCAIMIHPIIDACLELAKRANPPPDRIESIELTVSPGAVELSSLRNPKTELDATVSLYHWAAAAFIYKRAELDQATQSCILDPTVQALRNCISVSADPSIATDAARATLVLTDGSILTAHVPHCRGSIANAMTDSDLERKFRQQATHVLTAEDTNCLIRECWNIPFLEDTGTIASRFFQ